MELRQLRYFVAAAEAGNISTAAKKIFLTQPALSRQIKALEGDIGQPLLERRAHSIRLTPAGEELLRAARELLLHADQVRERIRASAQGVRLRVGYAPSLASGILSAAVADFSQAHPAARVELFDLTPGEMLAGLDDNKLDIALTVARTGKTPGLKWTHLARATWRLAVSRQHPLGRRRRLAPADVADAPLLVLSRRDYPHYWDTVTAWQREHRLRLKIAGEYDGAESLIAAVESGLGVAFITTRAARNYASRVHIKAVTHEPEPVCIAAGYRAERSGDKPLAVFIENMRQAAQSFA
ncbi:MAG: LysR family transcriptional regulator [Opitutaceae bacterium]|nr:LysR family transcriptional regulator [Opitutaceae bacterium]